MGVFEFHKLYALYQVINSVDILNKWSSYTLMCKLNKQYFSLWHSYFTGEITEVIWSENRIQAFWITGFPLNYGSLSTLSIGTDITQVVADSAGFLPQYLLSSCL